MGTLCLTQCRDRWFESIFNGLCLLKVELGLLPSFGSQLFAFFQKHLQSSLLQRFFIHGGSYRRGWVFGWAGPLLFDISTARRVPTVGAMGGGVITIPVAFTIPSPTAVTATITVPITIPVPVFTSAPLISLLPLSFSLVIERLTLGSPLIVNFLPSGSLLVFFESFRFASLAGLLAFDALFLIFDFFLLAHLFTPDLLALFSLGFHIGIVVLVRLAPRIFFLRCLFISDIFTANCADRPKDSIEVFSREFIDGLLNILVSIASVDCTLYQSCCFASFA